MADENNPDLIAEVVENDAPVKTPASSKKQRAPRSQKTAVAPVRAASKATSAKAPTGKPGKRGEQDRAGKLKSIETKVTEGASTLNATIKSAGRKKTAKQIEQTAKSSVLAIDEMADLVQLEEENQRLRRTLAEKLRKENAELRKRLGLD
ncbi:SyrB-like regulator [Rhizobium sp. LjRoot258]|uniref:SyrB-like regulator n=1 Tax=Rhizobium sp. LjRoot258 TaxID=3342299 RepID=UPI003ECCD8D4